MEDTAINNTTRSHIRQIQKAMRQNRLVVLVGAGASATCGVPSWSSLIDELKKELDVPEYETDFLKIPQLYKNMRKHKEYHERIKEILLDGQVQSSYVQDEILKLNPCHIITTNYDNLLEQAIVKSRDSYFVVKRDEDLPYNRGERMLLKMHGDFASDNIVLTEDDYLDYARNFPLMRSYVMSLFASKLVLLIGFSYSDINLKYILRDVKQSLGNKMQPLYMLASDSLNSHAQTYFDSNYIHVVTISDAAAKQALNTQHVEYEPTPFENEKSNTLYHQLLLLQKYSEQCNDFVNQVANFLSEYGDQFSTIGSYFKYIFPSEYRRDIRIQYGELELPREYKESLSRIMANDDIGNAYRKEYGEDLDKVMLWLHQNDIHKIADTSIDIDEYVKNIDIKGQVHPMKMFYTMDAANLTNWMEAQKNKPLTYSKDDMIYPYMLCVTGHYNDAYERYKYLADVMLAHGKYVLYFLCLYNIRALYGPVMNEMIGCSREAWSRVNKELSKIELNEVISRLPVEGAIKIILSDLENGKYLSNQLIDSEKFCNLLREQRENSERGGMSLNSNISHVINSFNEITDFQINNCIFNKPFGHSQTTNLRIAEGILHSLLTMEGKHEFGENTRLPALYSGIEYLFVFGLAPEEFRKLLYRVVGERRIAFDESFKLAIEGLLNNIYDDCKRNGKGSDCINKKVIGKVIINVMWISLYTNEKLSLPHIYELIAAYWFHGEIVMQDKLLNRFTFAYPASGADSVLVMDQLIHSQLHIMERLQTAIANLCYNIKEEGQFIKELISVKQIGQSEKVAFIASFCKGAESSVKTEIVSCLQSKINCLYHLIEAECLSGERIINEELLRKFKGVLTLGYINNLYAEEYVCANFAHMVSLPEYSDVKDVIEEIMEGNECYKFLKDPINYNGLSDIRGQWFYYLSDEHFKELLNNTNVRQLIKEFCENTAWSDDLRERMWSLL